MMERGEPAARRARIAGIRNAGQAARERSAASIEAMPRTLRSPASRAHFSACADRLMTCRFGAPQNASSAGQGVSR